MEYLDYFQDIKKFIVYNKLDSNSHIKGASISEIEQAIAKPIDEIPKAYIDFLKVFGKNHSEEAFSFDFILDSRSYDIEAAMEVNTTIANDPKNIIVCIKPGSLACVDIIDNNNPFTSRIETDTFIYFIKTSEDNPKVYRYPSANGIQKVEIVTELLTAFIRECAFREAESRRSAKEEFSKYIGDGKEVMSMLLAINKIRSEYILQIELRELKNGVISLANYEKEWKFLFENSDLFKNNTDYYKKWGNPYIFESKPFLLRLFS